MVRALVGRFGDNIYQRALGIWRQSVRHTGIIVLEPGFVIHEIPPIPICYLFTFFSIIAIIKSNHLYSHKAFFDTSSDKKSDMVIRDLIKLRSEPIAWQTACILSCSSEGHAVF